MLTTDTVGNILIAKIHSNRLDAESIFNFKQELVPQIKAPINMIILNLAEVTFIDSSGLGAIVSVKKVMGNSGGLVITMPQKSVNTMFRLTRMDKIFKIFNTDEEALAYLKH